VRSSLLCTDEVGAPGVENCENIHLSNKQYMAVHIGRLKEHEGSIFRIAWSPDGSKFMSVSDDRRSVLHFLCIVSVRFSLLKYLVYGTSLLQMHVLASNIGLMCLASLLWQCSHVDVKSPATEFYKSNRPK
jgi:WD40 repeat protein